MSLLGFLAAGATAGAGKGMADIGSARIAEQMQKDKEDFQHKHRMEAVNAAISGRKGISDNEIKAKNKRDRLNRESAERIAGATAVKVEDKRLATRRDKYLDKKDSLTKGARTEMQKLQVRKSKEGITDTEYNAAMKDIEKYYSWQERSLKGRYSDVFSNKPQTGTPLPVTPPPVKATGAFGNTGIPERPTVETPAPVTKLPDQAAVPASKGLMAQIGDAVRGNQQAGQTTEAPQMSSNHPLDYLGYKLYDAVTQRAK